MTTPPMTEGTSRDSTLTASPNANPAGARADWLFDFEPPRSLVLDQEALRIYEHAYALGVAVEEKGSPPITFSTVLAALLTGEDETSRWFARTAAEIGPDPNGVFAEKGLTRQDVQSHRPRPGRPDSISLSTDRHLLTSSARAVIQSAEQWAVKVGGTDIGVRHLIASYVLNPPSAHGKQMRKWKYQETKWRSTFFAWIAERYTAERWTDASQLAAPTKAIATFEQQKVKGEALAFPADENARAVLERAAQYHARRTDQWLRLQTVFTALVETARDDTSLRSMIQPIWEAVEAAGTQYTSRRDEFFPPPGPNRPVVAFSGLDISPRVLTALEIARELALASRRFSNGELQVGVLQFAGALVSRGADGDADLGSLGLDPRALRLALIKQAEQSGESGDVWRDALGEEDSMQAGRPVDLNSDEPEAVVRLDEKWINDPLGIRRDVETFAALLASKSLDPPLSIGLFGPWGSGKTTFLKRLRRAVEQRAEQAKASLTRQESTPYVSNIVHVDFNAWHFAESALTSSLVDTIFRALTSHIKNDKQLVGKAWAKQTLDRLETTKRKVEAAQAVEAAARDAVVKAETALADRREKAVSAATSVQEVLRALWSATKKELASSKTVQESGVLDAIGQTVNGTDEFYRRVEAVRNRPARMVSDLGWGRSLLFAGLVLVVPPLVAWLVGLAVTRDQAVQLFSQAAAILSVLGVWARTATGAVSKVDRAVNEVVSAYETKISEDPSVVEAQAVLATAEASAATAAASLQTAREELARAQAELANASLPAQMLQLVSSRIDADTYTKELTTLSLARADLQALSVILRDQRSSGTDGGEPATAADSSATEAVRPVDRLILYIDDLDRCKPEDVVRVLQLVHMLLAFELFVVVVAVDARWVEESLKQSYKWLADDGAPTSHASGNGEAAENAAAGRATPQDYLEKIFQIAFWLEPMTAARARSYLGSLVPAPVRESGPVIGSGIAGGQASASGSAIPVLAKVSIDGIELDYMRALAAYVGSSPRRVKRLMNAYRLIKAGMSDAQLAKFLTDRTTDDGSVRSGPYQIVIGLLVIGTGASSSSAQILKELSECDPRVAPETVVERFRAFTHPDWTTAAQVVETIIRTQRAKDMSEIRGWARKVGRFLLNGPAADRRLAGGRPVVTAAPAPVPTPRE